MNPSAARQSNVLVIENEAYGAFLQGRLEALGYRVSCALKGWSLALAQARAHCPALVLMDVPATAWTEAIAVAVQIREQLHLPVVILTDCDSRETFEQALVAEPFGYLRKPVQDRDLEIVLEMAIRKQQADQKTVAECKQAEAELHYSEQRFKIIEQEIRSFNAELEARVRERTADLARANSSLQSRTRELELFNKAMIGREKRVIELKEEVNQYCALMNQPPVYPPVWRQDRP